MRKLTLLSAVLLGLLLSSTGWANGAYKYSSTPHAPITFAQTTYDAIYVPANVKVADVRVAIYAKTVMFNSLYIALVSPTGKRVVLKNVSATVAYGSLGGPRSYALFRDDANTLGAQPNDWPVKPAERLSGFNGVSSMGYWQLQVVDDRALAVPFQNGYLEGWTLMFNQQKVEPVQPFNPKVDILYSGGAGIVGQLCGTSATLTDPNRAQIPNQTRAQLMCVGTPPGPNVVLGLNGDAFPIVITGHPGALIGQAANGYPAGSFRITVRVETNYRPGTPFLDAFTEDICLYFGRVPDNRYNPPLGAPPGPADPRFQLKRPAKWPTGTTAADSVSSLQGGSSTIYGGVRLGACISPVPSSDTYGYDLVTFNDNALDMIASGVPPGPAGGFSGEYRPQEPLSSLNGLPVDGLYYVTVYDAFGDNQNGFGHIRVTYLRVEYVVGGGLVADPIRHQGVASPLLGVPVPGAITGAPLGYLSDIVGTIPPYAVHAKDQDPILAMWATEKIYPKDATGTERIVAINTSNYAPPAGTHYHGPYAYPGILDSNPLVAGTLVNADVLVIPTGDYNLRINLMQARYDDDLGDNESQSNIMQVTNTSLSYIGSQIVSWNDWQNHGVGVVPAGTITANQAFAQSFTLFKNPSTTLTSIDYKLDKGLVVTPQSTVRMSVWACTNGLVGAPSTLVARSQNVTANEYIPGNWRSFPIYPVDANGNPNLTSPSVSLAPGTYAITIDNVGTGSILLYPYTYGLIPSLNDRHYSYNFTDKFGPLGPFTSLGTRMMYFSTDASKAPTTALNSNNFTSYSNCALPFRLNFTAMNDFAVNYVRFSSQTSPTEAITIGQPVTPTVHVTACSTQGGQNKDFNIYLGIYDAGNTLLYSDMVNVANTGGINGYQSLGINMQSWTPMSGGLYTVRAYFTRKPDDQNVVNDGVEYVLFVQAAPIVAHDGASQAEIDEAVAAASQSGASPMVVNVRDLKTAGASTIYYAGSMTDEARATLQSAVNAGSSLAFVYDASTKVGPMIEKADRVFGIDRGVKDYANLEIATSVTDAPAATVVTPVNLPKITSKEELLNVIKTGAVSFEAPAETQTVTPDFTNILPVSIVSGNANVTYVSSQVGNAGVLYAVPATVKGGKTDAAAPAAFALEQNYPNPFNPTTNIAYNLPEAAHVTLRVTDVLGREIMTLVNESQPAGRYNITWKGTDRNGMSVPSGSYFYRVDVTPVNGMPFSSTKKMVLSK